MILCSGLYGSDLDEEVKRWRFRSFLFLNLAILVEMSIVAFPAHFLVLASMANMAKSMCMLLASATKANANMRFAQNDNMGDIAAKAVSQYTLTSLIGFGLSMGLSKVFAFTTLSTVVPLFGSLTAINLTCGYVSA